MVLSQSSDLVGMNMSINYADSTIYAYIDIHIVVVVAKLLIDPFLIKNEGVVDDNVAN